MNYAVKLPLALLRSKDKTEFILMNHSEYIEALKIYNGFL